MLLWIKEFSDIKGDHFIFKGFGAFLRLDLMKTSQEWNNELSSCIKMLSYVGSKIKVNCNSVIAN